MREKKGEKGLISYKGEKGGKKGKKSPHQALLVTT